MYDSPSAGGNNIEAGNFMLYGNNCLVLCDEDFNSSSGTAEKLITLQDFEQPPGSGSIKMTLTKRYMTGNIDTTNVMCFYTDISVVDVHYHSCYQIVVSTKSTYDSTIEGRQYKGLKGFIIDKYTKHSCKAPQGSFLVYYIENKSFLGNQLKRMMKNEIFIDIKALLSEQQLDKLKTDFSKDNLTSAEIKKFSDNLLYTIFSGSAGFLPSEKKDDRIAKAIDFIGRNIGESLSLEIVASHIFLSPERTRHLFLEQMDIPFSQYVLWLRIKAVLRSVLQDKQTFLDASMQYGFTDQSHFNRFFKRMFGISATIIIKNSQFVQFIYPHL